MTEAEYIAATNLAKLRVAQRAVSDCMFVYSGQAATGERVVRELSSLVEYYESETDRLVTTK